MRLPNRAEPVVRRVSTAQMRQAAAVAASACLTVTYNNGRICADFPFIGNQCISIGGLPSGSGSATACVSYVFPDCAKICVSIGSTQIGCVKKCAL